MKAPDSNVYISPLERFARLVDDLRELQRYRQAAHAQLQVPILLLSLFALVAITLLPPPFPKWGCLLGLFAQPFWLRSTFLARQWGMHVLAWMYVGVYTVGFVVR